MKKLLSASLSVLFAASVVFPTLAADLPSGKAAPVSVPPPMWTGFYAGLNAGGTWANSNEQSITVSPVAEQGVWATRNVSARQAYLANFSAAASASGIGNNSAGFIGGAQIGYNLQISNGLVAGLEADIQGIASAGSQSTRSRSLTVGVYGPSFCYLGICGYRMDEGHLGINNLRNNLDYLGTVRGRLGFPVLPSLLVYGTGGLAYGGVRLSTTTLV